MKADEQTRVHARTVRNTKVVRIMMAESFENRGILALCSCGPAGEAVFSMASFWLLRVLTRLNE